MQNKHNVLESSLLKHQNDVHVLKKEKEKVVAKKEGEYFQSERERASRIWKAL